jgi:hypothetical protein
MAPVLTTRRSRCSGKCSRTSPKTRDASTSSSSGAAPSSQQTQVTLSISIQFRCAKVGLLMLSLRPTRASLQSMFLFMSL